MPTTPGPHDDAHEAALAALVSELADAHATFTSVLGVTPVGVRAVAIAEGRTAYVAALDGGAVACLVDDTLATRRRDVRQVITAGLVWEHLEEILDPEGIEYLRGAAARAIAVLGAHPEVSDAVAALMLALGDIYAWRVDPLRARVSLIEVDRGAALQEQAWQAYGAFVRASDPLVQRQEDLAPELVSALRVLEEAAGRAGITARMADDMGQVVRACDEAAPEIVDLHVTPLT